MTRSGISFVTHVEDEGHVLQAEARTLAEEVEAHDEDYAWATKELEVTERERVEAQACFRSRQFQELLRFQGEEFSSFVTLMEGDTPKERLKLLQNESAAATSRIREVQSELVQKDAQISQCRSTLARELPEAASLKRNLEARLVEAEEETRQARFDLDYDRRHLQNIADEEKHAEAAAQKALQEKKRGVDRMRAQLRHASTEHRQYLERVDTAWRDRFEKQVALRDDKNWQLQRRIAEAATVTRAARNASAQAAEELSERRRQLESVRARRVVALRSCEGYREAVGIDVAGVEVAARMESHSEALWARRQHEAFIAEKQRRIGSPSGSSPTSGRVESVVQDAFMSVDTSGDRLRLEVDALRAEVAHDSRWLQAEMANGLHPERPPIEFLPPGGAMGI